MRLFFSFIKKTLKFLEKEADSLNRVEIISKNILNNFDILKNESGNLEIFPVLKSNAYGHGIRECVKILSSRNIKYVAVDSYYEALNIREVSKVPVLIIGSNSYKNISSILRKKFTIAISDIELLRKINELGLKAKVHIALNTGMNREGFKINEIKEVINIIKKNKKIECEGLFSHLADADGENDDFTKKQEEEFIVMLDIFKGAGIKPKWVHLGNSAGFSKTNNLKINSFRPGIALYGMNPLSKNDSKYSKLKNIKPALRLVSRVVGLQKVSPGDSVGYNCTFKAKKEMTLGLLPLGYNEALDRRLSNSGFIKYKNNFLPIVGRVCMNLTSFDTRNVLLEIGDETIVISENPNDKNSVENIAKIIGTISYEILVRIDSSLRRVIVD